MTSTCPTCWGSGSVADEQLSRNFRLSELIDSTTARGQQIPNLPTPEVRAALRRLAVELLQPLRDRFGPLRVSSGFRSPELNAAVGGSSTSAHPTGYAADVVPSRACVVELMHFLATGAIPYDQAIIYDHTGHLHLGLLSPDGQTRHQQLVLRGGRYSPWGTSK